MSSLMAAVRGADEAYLTALANKGLYKRAVRELPEAGAQVSLDGETLRVAFADGTVVTMEGSVQSYACTCPSRSVCKHLLMAVLAAQAQPGEETAPPRQADPPDFRHVGEADPARLEKLAGKKAYRDALFAVQSGAEAQVEEGSTLTVALADSGHTVRFLPDTELDQSTCSCKAAGFCAHRVQAVLQYIRRCKGALPQGFLPEEGEGLRFSTWAVPHIRAFAQEALAAGLARMPQDMPGRFIQMATICHGQRLAGLERHCSRIAGHLERLASGSAAFDRERLIDELCGLLSLCDALEGGASDRETVGVFREQYRPIPPVDLLGLGSLGWRSAGGYTGVTTWFYCPQLSRMLTFTTALPDASAPKVERLYGQGAPWGVPGKLSGVSHSRLQLRGGRISDRGQLSSTGEGSAVVAGQTDIHSAQLEPVRYSDFAALLDGLWTQGGDSMVALLVPARYGASSFDAIKQTLTLPVYDSGERRVSLRVKYESATALLLENLARLEKTDKLDGPLLARVFLEGGRLNAFPIAHLGEARCNLSLDREKPKTAERQPYFDWGV